MKGRVRSFTNLDIKSQDDQIFDSNTTFFKDITKRLEQASQILPYHEFNILFKQIILRCIKKAQVDVTFTQAIINIQKWMQLYSYDLQILARTFILQANIIIKQSAQDALQKLTKAKYLIIDTDCEYLLAKVFIIESKVYDSTGQLQSKFKILKRCIEFVQNYTIQYLKSSNDIRMEVADNMIIAYFEMYKILSTEYSQDVNTIQYLAKAYQAALKNYGSQHFSTITLSQILTQQRNLQSNMIERPQKVKTDFLNQNIKRNIQLIASYSWEEELIQIKLTKTKNNKKRVLQQESLPIQLSMSKINLLKQNYKQWIQTNGTQFKVFEENVKKIIEDQINERQPSKKIRTVQRNDLFKKATEQPLSSSSDDEDIPMLDKEKQTYLRLLTRQKAHNISRTKTSRDRSKDIHTSRQ